MINLTHIDFFIWLSPTNFFLSIDKYVSIFQLQEPLLLLGKERFAGVDIRVRVRGGGHVAQIYGE